MAKGLIGQENDRDFWARLRRWFSYNSSAETHPIAADASEAPVYNAPAPEVIPVALPESMEKLNTRLAELNNIIEKNQKKASSRKSWGSFFLGAGIFNGIGVVGLVVLLALAPLTGPVGIAAIATAAVFVVVSAACYIAAYFSRKTVKQATQEKEVLIKQKNSVKTKQDKAFRDMAQQNVDELQKVKAELAGAQGTIRSLRDALEAAKEDAAKQVAAAHAKAEGVLLQLQAKVARLTVVNANLEDRVKDKDAHVLTLVERHNTLLIEIEKGVIAQVAELYAQYLRRAENKSVEAVQEIVQAPLAKIETQESNHPEERFRVKWALVRGWMDVLADYYQQKYSEMARAQSPDAVDTIQYAFAAEAQRKDLLARKVVEAQTLIELVKQMYLRYLQKELNHDLDSATKLVDSRFAVDERDKLGSAPFTAAAQVLEKMSAAMFSNKKRTPSSAAAANSAGTRSPFLTVARGQRRKPCLAGAASKVASPVFLHSDFAKILTVDFEDTEQKQATLRTKYCQYLLREVIRPLCVKHQGAYWNSAVLAISTEKTADYTLIASALSLVYALMPSNFPADDFMVHENNTHSLSITAVKGYSGVAGFAYPNDLESMLASDVRMAPFLKQKLPALSAEEKLAQVEALSVLLAQDEAKASAYTSFVKELHEDALELAPALSQQPVSPKLGVKP